MNGLEIDEINHTQINKIAKKMKKTNLEMEIQTHITLLPKRKIKVKKGDIKCKLNGLELIAWRRGG